MKACIVAVALGIVLISGCDQSDTPPPPPPPPPQQTEAADSAPVSAGRAGRTLVSAESRMAAQRLRDSMRQAFRDRMAEAERTADQTAIVRIASTTPHATLYVNDVEEGPLTSAGRAVRVQAGVVRLVIQAPPCAAWDTVLSLPPRAQAAIGMRKLRC